MCEFVERSIWFPLLLSDLVFLALGTWVTWIVITAPLNRGYIQYWIIEKTVWPQRETSFMAVLMPAAKYT